MKVTRRDLLKSAAATSALAGTNLRQPLSAARPVAKRGEGDMRVIAFPRAVPGDPSPLSAEALRHVRQIGVEDIRIVSTWVPGYAENGEMDLEELIRVKRFAASFGIRIGAVYLQKVDTANLLLDRPGWKEELDKICRTIECLGKASIPVLEHSLLLSRVIRDVFKLPLPGHSRVAKGRGGARLTTFDGKGTEDQQQPVGPVSRDQMWERITRFQERCVPVASEAKVHLACHPDDPPMNRYWGVTQVLNTKEGLDRLIQIVPSEYNGILLCLGTMQESGADVLELIRYFGEKRKIFDIDFRGVQGTVPNYNEVFLDEGDLDMWKAVQVLKEVDYRWTLEPDHLPGITADIGGGLISYAWAVGYMKALIAAAEGSAA